MTTSRFVSLAFALSFACAPALLARTAAAQQFAGSDLPTYKEYRAALLAEGWKPDPNFGLKTNNGRPLYRFPEVLCGPRICDARWSRKGEERLVRLLRGDADEEYRVAPR